MANVDEILAKYIELRDRKAAMAKKQSDEMAPLNEAMGTIENYLMHLMNELGVDQLKAAEVGTAFKASSTSCQMQDAEAFKEFIFAPATEGIIGSLEAAGLHINALHKQTINNVIRTLSRWDMVDFRAGKKGITEFIANENTPVPGVAINTVATINVRRA